jgi:hypothetical protein
VPNTSYLEVHGFDLVRYMAQLLVIEDDLAQAADRPTPGVQPAFRGMKVDRSL